MEIPKKNLSLNVNEALLKWFTKINPLQWGITPLVDNFPEDCYFYVVKVFTGMRPGAGTKSKVAFVLSGDEMDTGVRELTDGIRQVIS